MEARTLVVLICSQIWVASSFPSGIKGIRSWPISSVEDDYAGIKGSAGDLNYFDWNQSTNYFDNDKDADASIAIKFPHEDEGEKRFNLDPYYMNKFSDKGGWINTDFSDNDLNRNIYENDKFDDSKSSEEEPGSSVRTSDEYDSYEDYGSFFDQFSSDHSSEEENKSGSKTDKGKESGFWNSLFGKPSAVDKPTVPDVKPTGSHMPGVIGITPVAIDSSGSKTDKGKESGFWNSLFGKPSAVDKPTVPEVKPTGSHMPGAIGITPVATDSSGTFGIKPVESNSPGIIGLRPVSSDIPTRQDDSYPSKGGSKKTFVEKSYSDKPDDEDSGLGFSIYTDYEQDSKSSPDKLKKRIDPFIFENDAGFGLKVSNSEKRAGEEDSNHAKGSNKKTSNQEKFEAYKADDENGSGFGINKKFDFERDRKGGSSPDLDKDIDFYDNERALGSGVKPVDSDKDPTVDENPYYFKKKPLPKTEGDNDGNQWYKNIKEKFYNLKNSAKKSFDKTFHELKSSTKGVAKSAKETVNTFFDKMNRVIPNIWVSFQKTLYGLGSMLHKGAGYIIQKITLTFDEAQATKLISKLQKKLEEGDEVVDEFFQKVGEKVTAWEEQSPHLNVDEGLLSPEGEHLSKHFGDPHFSDLFQDKEIKKEFKKMIHKGILNEEEVKLLTQKTKGTISKTQAKAADDKEDGDDLHPNKKVFSRKEGQENSRKEGQNHPESKSVKKELNQNIVPNASHPMEPNASHPMEPKAEEKVNSWIKSVEQIIHTKI